VEGEVDTISISTSPKLESPSMEVLRGQQPTPTRWRGASNQLRLARRRFILTRDRGGYVFLQVCLVVDLVPGKFSYFWCFMALEGRRKCMCVCVRVYGV
jgi:hypothetical protein